MEHTKYYTKISTIQKFPAIRYVLYRALVNKLILSQPFENS